MHTSIHKEDGGYYLLLLFGYYRNVIVVDSYKRYKEEIHNPFYVVWNEDRTKFIKWLVYHPNTKYIISQITII